MGCLVVLFALITPRLALIWLWLSGDLLSRSFDGAILPLIGFFLLPWTTLGYVVMWDVGTNRVSGFEWFVVAVAFLADLGALGGGASSRRDD
jgi:hypothetical protein